MWGVLCLSYLFLLVPYLRFNNIVNVTSAVALNEERLLMYWIVIEILLFCATAFFYFGNLRKFKRQ